MKIGKKPKPEQRNWYKDRYQRLLVQRKMLFVLALASLGTTLFTALSIVQLVPLKVIEPYVIQVDPKSGTVQTVDPASVQDITMNQSVNNYFIVQYIRARENYDDANLAYNYNRVRLMSDAGSVYGEFLGETNPNNPQSNLARLGSTGVRVIRIKSITYLKPQVVQVRLAIDEKGPGGVKELHRIVLMTFDYVTMNLSLEDRYLNPLGFRVTEYRVTEDM